MKSHKKLKKIILSYLLILIQSTTIEASEQERLFSYVDFYASQNIDNKFNSQAAEKNPTWIKIKSLYNKYFGENIITSEKPRIPKIIHQLWVGEPLPEKYRAFQQTWIENHPDWEYKLWTDQDLEELDMFNRELFDNTINYGSKADIARLEILYQFGGLYVDTDFVCLKPFDILHHCCDFYAGCDSSTSLVIFNGLIGTIPHHPILKRCIENFKKPTRTNETSMDIYARTGPPYFTPCVVQELHNCNEPWIIFPVSYFYPWPHYRRNQNKPEQIQQWIRPETFAVHHWHVAWNNGKPP